ncbi:hypothetical protein DRO30_03760, partial [Candidatus Bathyarchaeota archaeon]
MIDFKYDIRTGKIHLLDTSNLDSYIFSILKSGFDLGDNTIYLRPSYIDMDGNPIKNTGAVYPKSDKAYDLGTSSYRWSSLKTYSVRFESKSGETPYIVNTEYSAGIRFYH